MLRINQPYPSQFCDNNSPLNQEATDTLAPSSKLQLVRATSHSGNSFPKVNLAEMGQSIVSSSKKTLNMFMTIKCIPCIFVLYLKILLHFIYLLCVFAYPCTHAVINMYQSYGSQGSMCPKQQVPLSTELHH